MWSVARGYCAARWMRSRSDVLEEDVAHRAGELIGDEHRLLVLDDLERERHVGRARNARHVALDLRVAIDPVLAVLVALGGGFGFVRDLAAFHNAHAARHGPDGAKLQHRDVGQRSVGAIAELQRVAGHVALHVVVGGADGLPDAIEIGFAVG